MNGETEHEIAVTDASPTDRFVFIADETGERFVGTILERTGFLVRVRWKRDRHESWTPLIVKMGTVRIYGHG